MNPSADMEPVDVEQELERRKHEKKTKQRFRGNSNA